MRKAISLALLLMVAMFCNAQMANPVKFTSQLKTGNTAEGEIIFSGKIERDGTSILPILVATAPSRRHSMSTKRRYRAGRKTYTARS